LNIWGKLLKKYPGNPGVLIHMGSTYSRMGQCQRALDIYSEVIDKLQDEMLTPISSIHYRMGEVYFDMNSFKEAAGSYLKAVETDTLYSGNRRWTYSRSLYKLGQSFEMLGDTVQAKKYYSKIDEDNERSYDRARDRIENPMTETEIALRLARNNMDCSNFDEALQRFDELLARKDQLSQSDILEIEYYKGEILFHQGHINSAIQQFNNLLAMERREDEWYRGWGYYYRGRAYLKLGMEEQARNDFEYAADTDSRSLEDRVKKELMLLEK
jgi:tetratricopeptide (TPR) repeat protein